MDQAGVSVCTVEITEKTNAGERVGKGKPNDDDCTDADADTLKKEDRKMNIEERAAQAAAWKAAGQCNCAQAVLKAFEDRLPVDTNTLMQLGAGYAAGMGCMESTCGALIGAVMVAGVATDGKGTPRISKELLQNFQDKCGATLCKDLKGMETGAPLCPCPECVRNAVLALGEVLGE